MSDAQDLPAPAPALQVHTDPTKLFESLLRDAPFIGALIIDMQGLVVAGTTRAAESVAFGHLDTLQLEADAGHVVIADAGETAVVAVADRSAQLGLVRLEVHRAAEALK